MNTHYYIYMLLAAGALNTATAFAQEQDEENSQQRVNVAFRSVAAEDMLGGVSSINYEELATKNNESFPSNLQGYVSGYNGASLWGFTDFLVLVDGVPREISNVKAEEIAEITFLKGAQAVVLYGSRAAKGVVLVTTKRGVDTDLQVKVNANTGWNVAKAYPEYLGSAEYMTLYNEARANDGLSALYSESDIYNYGSGINPYRYPNVNMYSSDYLKKAYNRSEISAEFRGGAGRTRYYTNVGYMRIGDQFDFGKAKNNYTDRLNVRGNVDMKLSDWLTAFADANVTFYSQRTANGTGDYWASAATLRPNRISPLIPLSYLDQNSASVASISKVAKVYDGGILGGSSLDETNVIANMYAAGKNNYYSRHFEFSVGLNMDLASVLKGLTFHTMFALDYATTYNVAKEDSYASYYPTWSNYSGDDAVVSLTKYGVDKHSEKQLVRDTWYTQTMLFNAHFDYNRTFGEDHNVSAMLLANGYQQTESAVYHATSNVNAGLQASYNYAHRYYAELGTALVHSAKLAEGNRKGFNYAATLGWNLARENFMEGSLFNDLMLSASYSELNEDIDISDYYMYSGNFSQADGAWWGWGVGSSLRSTNSLRGSNSDLDFIKRKEFSTTLRGSLLRKSLSFEASYFRSSLEGLIIVPNNLYPSFFTTYYPEASFIPYTNYNEDRRWGFDLGVKYEKQLNKDWKIGAGVNMTYYDTEATKRDDSNYADAYQYRQGKALDAIWGYECLGFFNSQEEIDAAPEQNLGETPRPGDLRYKDQNGDNVIDSKDQVDLGRGGWYGNPFTLGINFTAKWKNLSLFVLGTGGFGGHAIKNNSYWWVAGDGKYSAAVRDRWTEATKNTATYPRLTTQTGTNNFVTSDFWMYSTDQFNLSKVQLTYDFSDALFDGKIVKGLSVFASGSGLLRIAKERELLDTNIGTAPQTRFYQIGASVKF